MHRVARKHLLVIEYFSRDPASIPYRGRDNLLFKRDFGARFLELFPELEPIGQGFFWRLTTAFDDTIWWLFRKPTA